MSNYSDVNQLLEELGVSDRSADDPWTITRHSHTFASGTSFTPAVSADLGEPATELNSEMQAAEQIAKADEIVTSPTGAAQQGTSKGSTGSGILGGLLDLFPLGNVFGKLFGLGGSSSPPPLTPYIAPPSVNFQGAMPSVLSQSTVDSLEGTGARTAQGETGVSNLTYGENGMPKALSDVAQLATPADQAVSQLTGLSSSNYVQQQVNSSSGDVMGTEAAQASSGAAQGQSILVQVQAMDSQSFMDHSSDIAQAVRQAMLNMHSVNDVIAEL